MQPITIVRYGGYGDHIFMSATFPFLYEQHAGMNLEVDLKGLELFVNDPRFDYVSVFDLHSYGEEEQHIGYPARWEKIKKDCDANGRRFLNFWSSMENSCLLYEFNEDVKLPLEKRREKYNSNYYEKAFEIAEVKMPSGWVHENSLHFHESEIAVMERWRKRNEDSFCVLMVLGGSSRQKVFLWMQDFCKKLIDTYPKMKIYILGGKEFVNDVWQYERTFSLVNGASNVNVIYKQAILLTKYADYVVGGETGLLVAAGMMGTPKSCLFTISNKDQLVNYHRNDFSLQSQADCSPCHVMAYTGTICERESLYNTFPKCIMEFDLDKLQQNIEREYCKRF